MSSNLVVSAQTNAVCRGKPSCGVPRPSLRDAAYEAIKRRIITCDLRPGEVVSAAELSEFLGIGRTPVNQAIDRLMTDGLVEVMPRKGIVVRPVSLDEVLDIIDVRLVNEAHCVRKAAERADPALIAFLEGNVTRTAEAAGERDIEGMMELDRAFHTQLSLGAGNIVLSEILSKLHDRSARFWFISLRAPKHHRRVCEQHAAITAAIRAHDPNAAERAVRDHIQAFRANVARQL